MTPFHDYYATLGVLPTASPDEIQSVYRRLARQTHPDLNPRDPDAADRMRLLNESYAHLSNDGLRSAFDARRAEVLRARTQTSDAGRDGWRRTSSASQADSRLHMRRHGADPPTWPAERAGWTVELAQEDDPVIADRVAALAREKGILAGVLNTSHHPSLIPERWLVFAGFYESRNLASRAAKKADAKFAGARPIYVSERM